MNSQSIIFDDEKKEKIDSIPIIINYSLIKYIYRMIHVGIVEQERKDVYRLNLLNVQTPSSVEVFQLIKYRARIYFSVLRWVRKMSVVSFVVGVERERGF